MTEEHVKTTLRYCNVLIKQYTHSKLNYFYALLPQFSLNKLVKALQKITLLYNERRRKRVNCSQSCSPLRHTLKARFPNQGSVDPYWSKEIQQGTLKMFNNALYSFYKRVSIHYLAWILTFKILFFEQCGLATKLMRFNRVKLTDRL